MSCRNNTKTENKEFFKRKRGDFIISDSKYKKPISLDIKVNLQT